MTDKPKLTTAEAAKALADALTKTGFGATVCYSQCWACQFGQCYEPARQHPWWDADDVEHAAATGQPAPIGDCACDCARPNVEEPTP